MVTEIRLYVEGGGDQRDTKDQIRRGFGQFLQSLRIKAQHKKIRWSIIACGSRQATFEAYQLALESHPQAFNLLLVDAESAVQSIDPWEHLKNRDNWKQPNAEAKHCHLMVQIMETWLVADRKSLQDFYGKNFNSRTLPKTKNLEEVAKDTLMRSLESATSKTQPGKYHKTRHAPKLLEKIRLEEVCAHASWCNRLVTTLLSEMEDITPQQDQ